MAKYSASGISGALTTSLKSAVGIGQPASGMKGALAVYQVVLGSTDTTTDANLEWTIQLYSTAGTSTAVTPTDVEDLGQTAVAAAGQTYTAEPTVVSNTTLFDMGINQRATYTIVLASGYEWKVKPTASRTLTCAAKHASATSKVNAVLYWNE
jgi:hypothetical protein